MAMLSLNAKIAVGGWGRSRSRAAASRPRVDLGLGLHLELRIRQDSGRRERRAVAATTILGGEPAARAGDLGDPPVTELEQVSHRLVGTRGVRGRDRRDPLVERHQRVEHDKAVAAVEQPLELFRSTPRAG